MASCLEKLTSYLDHLKIAEGEFGKMYTADQIQLLKRKGIFPYEYVTSLNIPEEGELPAKEGFHSSLYDRDISDKEYQEAREVWERFDIKSLGEYSDLYLKTDVLLLADVFENFRDNCLEAYDLDPAHYYTTPGLT